MNLRHVTSFCALACLSALFGCTESRITLYASDGYSIVNPPLSVGHTYEITASRESEGGPCVNYVGAAPCGARVDLLEVVELSCPDEPAACRVEGRTLTPLLAGSVHVHAELRSFQDDSYEADVVFEFAAP